MKNDQTNLVIPRVFYKPTFASTLEVEITGFTVLSWCNRCNNNGSFSLTIPLDLIDFTPSNQGLILCKYYTPDYPDGFYNVVQYIEKIETVSDQNGMKSMLITGSPRQCTLEDLSDAQVNGAFYIWKLDGNGVFYKARYDANSPSIVHDIDDSNMIDARHVIDNYGGTEGSVLYTWGTRMTGIGRPESITTATLNSNGIVYLPGETSSDGWTIYGRYMGIPAGMQFYDYYRRDYQMVVVNGIPTWQYIYSKLGYQNMSPNDGSTNDRYYQLTYPLSATTHTGLSTVLLDPPILEHGASQGAQGYMNDVSYSGSWGNIDTTNNQVVSNRFEVIRVNAFADPATVTNPETWMADCSASFSIRRITLKTNAAYLAAMEAAMPNPSSGVVYNTADTIPPGHESFGFTLKSYGNSPFGQGGASYPTGLDIGDKVHAVHEGLGIEATDIISGVLETIDQNGYNIELELGTIYPLVQRRD